jgi:predicted TIM-barrel fold metal-dependent hydrolase
MRRRLSVGVKVVEEAVDRRRVLAGIAALPAVPGFARAAPGASADVPRWPSPVIDMHFHMRRTPEANIAHQQGAGVTAANLLARAADVEAVRGLQAADRAMFPCWFVSADVSNAESEAQLTAGVKAGAKGFGELKSHVASDGPQMRRAYALAAELGAPVLIHFQEVTATQPAGDFNTGFRTFAKVLEAFPRTKFIAHGNAFWANISADYDGKTDYPTGPIKRGGVADKLLADYPNLFGDMSANSGNTALWRDRPFATEFLKRHQDKLHFGSDCGCLDGRGRLAGAPDPVTPVRNHNKCVARETLGLMAALSTPQVFRKLAWTNAHRLIGLPA